MEINQYTDSELITIYKQGDNPNYAFNLIVSKYQEKVYWHIRRIVISHDDSDDVTQNTFIKVWKNLNNFNSQSSLYTWIYRIATNEALAFLRRKKYKYLIPIVDVESKLSNSLESDVYYSGDEIQLKLQKALLKLPEKQRLVFNMKYFEEMRYEDMSMILNTSIGALKASYHHAVKKIKDFLHED